MDPKFNERGSAASTPNGTAGEGIASEAKQTVEHVAGQAKEQVSRQLDVRKEGALEKMSDVADALRGTSEKLRDTGPIADVADRAAEGIERLAGYLRNRSIGDLVGEVESFARREPAIFLGSALALGLIGGRFLKSSSRSSSSFESEGGYYGRAYDEGYDDESFDDEWTNDLGEEPLGTRAPTAPTPSSSFDQGGVTTSQVGGQSPITDRGIGSSSPASSRSGSTSGPISQRNNDLSSGPRNGIGRM